MFAVWISYGICATIAMLLGPLTFSRILMYVVVLGQVPLLTRDRSAILYVSLLLVVLRTT